MSNPKKVIQDLTEKYQSFQSDLQSAVEARQKLESQQQENQSVKKEFELLSGTANIYKMIGPVLMKQEKSEATMSVNGRLEFIEKEIKRVEGQISEIQNKAESVKSEIINLQSQTAS
ncbi:putative prefoldin subunit 6 [Eremomyces bilateralis CBS 781.70]|uniref:Prefoldin subunit 6 n=1 Tax=Eremomyces bilateralis CBS 781.70 TaxID=1392243 RepID=A0A6G1FXF9_9PEZI|nr:putative prefoldin subunit 6 [Eremomyces bilateralis CBS 781.70]KAF1810585.1 putative prefoldin subunit 6 [Eremomyces bilateralis CBS 781.70]